MILMRVHVPQNQGRHDKLQICTTDTDGGRYAQAAQIAPAPVTIAGCMRTFFSFDPGTGLGMDVTDDRELRHRSRAPD